MKESRKFYEENTEKFTREIVISVSVLSIVVAASCLVDVLFGDVIAIVSVFFYLCAGLVLLVYRNWMIPLSIVIYGVFFSTMIFDGTTLLLAIVVSFASLISFVKIRKVNVAYMKFCKYGELPNKKI